MPLQLPFCLKVYKAEQNHKKNRNMIQQDEIITLYTFKDIVEATLAVDQLNANKIESFLEDTTASGLNPMGGVELKVFFKDKEEAERVIEEFKN